MTDTTATIQRASPATFLRGLLGDARRTKVPRDRVTRQVRHAAGTEAPQRARVGELAEQQPRALAVDAVACEVECPEGGVVGKRVGDKCCAAVAEDVVAKV